MTRGAHILKDVHTVDLNQGAINRKGFYVCQLLGQSGSVNPSETLQIVYAMFVVALPIYVDAQVVSSM